MTPGLCARNSPNFCDPVIHIKHDLIPANMSRMLCDSILVMPLAAHCEHIAHIFPHHTVDWNICNRLIFCITERIADSISFLTAICFGRSGSFSKKSLIFFLYIWRYSCQIYIVFL